MREPAIDHLILGLLEPVQDLIKSYSVTEILVNNYNSIFYEEDGKLHKTSLSFADESELRTLVTLLAQNAGVVLHEHDFELDTSIAGPPPLRIHANFGSTSPCGINISIRRLSRRQIDLEAVVEKFSTISRAAVEYLRLAVLHRRNILISGGTGSGKTTLLNCLGELIPEDERIVLIEDTKEIELKQADVVSLVTRKPDRYGEGSVTLRDLFRSSLRLRPDRIIIGEVRGSEAIDLIQALGSGHSGSLCTIHANSPWLALARLQTLALMSDVAIPSGVLRQQISQVIQVVLQIDRLSDGSRKVTRIDRCEEPKDDNWQVGPLFNLVVSDQPAECRSPSLELEYVAQRDPLLASIPAQDLQNLAPCLAREASRRGE